VLEVGTGLGDLSLLLSEKGWEVWGCDPAGDSASACREILGDRFVPTGLEQAALPEGSFEVVLLNFSLEHMERPRAAMARVGSLLRPGGMVLIRVPNIDAAMRGSIGAGFQLQLPHHCSFFGPDSLGQLLESEGFVVKELVTPLSLLEGVSIACQLVPALDPEQWIHRPLAPTSLLRTVVLAKLAILAMPWAWLRCRRGEGVILSAVARRRADA
jgi:SAM-dependent methyltransferase